MVIDSSVPELPKMSSQAEVFVKHWRELPSWSAPTINSEEELSSLEKFETPLLGGGLGSMMFQIAMVRRGFPCLNLEN
jgi:hypothetical protein